MLTHLVYEGAGYPANEFCISNIGQFRARRNRDESSISPEEQSRMLLSQLLAESHLKQFTIFPTLGYKHSTSDKSTISIWPT